MLFTPRSIAVQGVGFGTFATATQGFYFSSQPQPPIDVADDVRRPKIGSSRTRRYKPVEQKFTLIVKLQSINGTIADQQVYGKIDIPITGENKKITVSPILVRKKNYQVTAEFFNFVRHFK